MKELERMRIEEEKRLEEEKLNGEFRDVAGGYDVIAHSSDEADSEKSEEIILNLQCTDA